VALAAHQAPGCRYRVVRIMVAPRRWSAPLVRVGRVIGRGTLDEGTQLKSAADGFGRSGPR
jgi:hypothetical protein